MRTYYNHCSTGGRTIREMKLLIHSPPPLIIRSPAKAYETLLARIVFDLDGKSIFSDDSLRTENN